VGRSRLPNGLRLVTIQTPHLHSAAISLYVRAGSRYETPRTNGLSHFVEHMLFRGSAQFPNSFALNLAIEEIGGTLYAETGRDYSLYQIPLQPAELPRGLEILGDLFSTPSFRDIDLERQTGPPHRFELVRHVARCGERYVGADDDGACVRETERNRAPDALTGSGHDRNLVVEAECRKRHRISREGCVRCQRPRTSRGTIVVTLGNAQRTTMPTNSTAT